MEDRSMQTSAVCHQDGVASEDAVLLGAENLIEGCFGQVAGKTVLVVAEDPVHGWYDREAPDSVARLLAQRGASVSKLTVGAPQNEPIRTVQDAMTVVDEVIFFARIGDQGRFHPKRDPPNPVMSYALNAAMLGSGYGTLDHKAMIALKDAVDAVTLSARQIRVTCPLGTEFEGSPGPSLAEGGEVAIRRYPMGVPKPVLINRFSGVVKIAHYLTPTGSRVYQPAYLTLPHPVTAHIDGNLITRFDGTDSVVKKVRAHYDHVAALFDLDAYNIDSWHAGIHPLMGYDMPVAKDPVRWAQTVFANPRVLHFHSCGMGPPGEICLMVIDPTITIDGVTLWENGRFHPERHERTNAVLLAAPHLAAAMTAPVSRIGMDGLA